MPYQLDTGPIKKILKDSIGLKSRERKIKEPKKRVKKIATIGDR